MSERWPKLHYADLIGKPIADYGRGPEFYDCLGIWLEIRGRLHLPRKDFGSLALGLTRAISNKVFTFRSMFLPRQERKLISAGDLVLIKSDKDPNLCAHIGTMVERGKFLHTCRTMNVHRSDTDHPLWRQMIEGIYEFVGG